MRVIDLGLLDYRDAWAIQEDAHAHVLGGGEERIFLVEHPPVITFGRRPNVARHLLVSDEQLARLGVDVLQSDRGGDITFHGRGQIVAYPIIRLNDHGLSVGSYVHALERLVIETLAGFGIQANADKSAVGVWVEHEGRPKKICALGIRIRRGVSLHGIALNVTTDLSYFSLIVPCGLVGRGATSMRSILGDNEPDIGRVKQSLSQHLLTLNHHHPSSVLAAESEAGPAGSGA